MSDQKEKKGGFVVGGIGFGGGDTPAKKGVPVSREVDGASAAPLLPLRVLIVAELTPRRDFNAGTHPPDRPVRVEPAGVDELFRVLAPRLALEVDSVLADGARARIDLPLTGLKTFRPDGLCGDVPLLKSLLEGRRVLEQLRDGTVKVDGARGELERLWSGSPLVARVLGGVSVRPAPTGTGGSAPAPQRGGEDSVSRILDMVGGGSDDGSDEALRPTVPAAEPPSGARGQIAAFITAFVQSNAGGANPDAAIRMLDKAIGLQVGAILQHPEVRRLEEAWRGVAFLASRAPKNGVRLEVMCASVDDAAAALEKAIRAGAGTEPPVSYAVVDLVVGGDAASLARLRAIADVAEGQTVPVIVNATAQLFGHEDLRAVDKLDNKAALFEAPARAPWRSEAYRPAMRWVVLALNRVLARKSYDKQTARLREVPTFQEQPADFATATVWMQPAWAVGSLPLRSFAKTSWPAAVTGARDFGVVEDLPVHELSTGYEGDEKIACPTEVFLSTESQRALSRLGLTALASEPNTDSCYLMTAPTAYVTPPKKTYDSDTTEPEMRLPVAPLGDQLFVARIVQLLRALGARIPPGENPREIEQVLEGALWELFEGQAPTGLELKVQLERDESGDVANVTVRPRRFCGVQMEEITLGVPLG